MTTDSRNASMARMTGWVRILLTIRIDSGGLKVDGEDMDRRAELKGHSVRSV